MNRNTTYQNSYVSLTNMTDKKIAQIVLPEEHKYIKEDLLELINQVDENNKYVVSFFKIIPNLVDTKND